MKFDKHDHDIAAKALAELAQKYVVLGHRPTNEQIAEAVLSAVEPRYKDMRAGLTQNEESFLAFGRYY